MLFAGGLVVALVVFGVCAWQVRRDESDGRRDLAASLALAAALVIVAAVTLSAQRHSGEAHLVLMPFKNLADALDGEGGLRVAIAELVGNVLLFIPLGMALRWRLPRLSVATLTLLAAAASVTVEVLQAILATGRWATTTDIITNTTGGLLGVIAGGMWLRGTGRFRI